MSIESGTIYKLTRDVKNPKPDLRQKYDWRSQSVWKAGTLFRAQTRLSLSENAGVSIYTGRHSHYEISPRDAAWDLIVPHLVQELSDFTHNGVNVTFSGEQITFARDDTNPDIESVYYGRFSLSDKQDADFKRKIAIAICEVCE